MSKNLIFGEPAKITTIRLYSWEKALVRAYIKLIRDKKKKEILKEKKNEDGRRNTNSKRKKLGEISDGKS